MANRLDPYKNFKFRPEIDGIGRAGFNECSGVNVEASEAVRKLPGLGKYGTITLKRGYTKDRSMSEWHQENAAGKTERKSGSIILLDEAGIPKTRWNFVSGWPRKWRTQALCLWP
jgi:phage tail-like protein